MENTLSLIIAFGIFLLIVASIAFWIWMLIDCVKYTPPEDNTKLLWALIIVLTGQLGAAIYFFVQRPKNIKLR